MSEDSVFLHKESCPNCGSRDNLARYSDGHAYCFGCEHREPADGETHQAPTQKAEFNPVAGEFRPLSKRGISQETCQLYGYRVGHYHDQPAHICDVRNRDGKLVAQKIRLANKDFAVVGSLENCLIGMHRWPGGKRLIITEGEIDLLSWSQVQGNKWPVVSLPNGAKAGKKTLAHNLDYLKAFQEVCLSFDMDDPGQEAVAECAELLISAGVNVKVIRLPLKDANDVLLQDSNAAQTLINAMFNAQPYRPDGMVTLAEIIEDALRPPERGLPWWLPELTAATYGRRHGEIHVLGAGTGMGKTDFIIQQVAYDLYELRESVGLFFLEQAPAETAKRIAGKRNGIQYHKPDTKYDPDHFRKTLMEVSGQLHLYDNFGQCDWTAIKVKVLFLITQGVRIFYVDYLTALATGGEKNEKEELEAIMGDIAEFAKAHNVLFILISHLTTPEGKSHEEGGRVTIRQFKGSRAIGFWSYFMYGMERNQQAEDEETRHTTIFRVLKDRLTGQAVGLTIPLGYDKTTGLLSVRDCDREENPFADGPEDPPPF